jgi:ribosomal protein L29
MEFKELKKKSSADLRKALTECRDKLKDLRFKDANKQLKNVREIRVVRQTIARIMTLLNAGNHAGSSSADDKPGTGK